MPILNIQILEGRTVEQKRAMAKAVTEAICTSLSVPADAVKIIITDMAKTNFASAGELKCDTVQAKATAK